jgi:hypothetical protein
VGPRAVLDAVVKRKILNPIRAYGVRFIIQLFGHIIEGSGGRLEKTA